MTRVTLASLLRPAIFLWLWSVIGFAALYNQGAAQPVAGVFVPLPVRGQAAINALGSRLPTVASAYGISAQELTSLFQRQPSLGIDTSGTLVFACNGLTVTNTPAQSLAANTSTSQLAFGGTVDAFQLHSLPGASRVIYLDFDGHTTTGTAWNASFTGGAAIVSQPFDLDGDPTTFSAAERAVIQGIWKRVAEDYAPFAIDVTTQDPGIEALRRTSGADSAYGVRVVISPTNWYDTGAGGTAYIGCFNWNSDTPCFVFTQQLANAEKYIAEAVAHECGHTLGLYHDGIGGSAPSEYYFGHGDWAPIMGVGYYKSIVQFSKGEYTDATNIQDDLAVIATYAPVAADDHGNTLATATVITGPTVATGGTIERSTDVDVFRFATGTGTIALAIAGPSPSPNLDIKAELLNSGGAVLQTSDLATLDASISASVTAGTYYLRISGVGAGGGVNTGYSSYGSIGNYIITGTLPAVAANQAPVAVVTPTTASGLAPLTVNFTGSGSSDADGSITTYAWNFGDGGTSALANPTHIYSSAGNYTATLTVTDNGGLTGSATVSVTATSAPPTVTVPSNIVAEATGASGAVVTFATSAVSSTGAVLGTVNSPASGTTFALGVTTVTASATDSGGNTATKTFTVTVVDTTPPAITVPAALTVPATGAGGAVVTFVTTANDSVSGARVTTNSPVSGTTFPVGTTSVTTTASDAAGNTATKTFTVTVTALAAPGAPTGLAATAGDSQVNLTWNAAAQASGYRVKRATTSGGSYTTVASNLTATSYTDTGLSNGSTYYYIVTATNAGGESGNSAEASVTLPGGGTGTTSYVTATVLGSVRNNYTGWIGIQIVVGANPLTVSQLGRVMAPGNTGTHAVKLVKASDGQDVAGSVVNIATSGGTVGQFQYAALNSPVTLAANTTYLLVTQETAGGDVWYDYYATVTTTGVATDTAVVWGTGPGDWSALGVSNQAFGPLDFKYGNAVTAGPPTVTVPSNMVAEATGASGAVVTFTTSAVSSTGAVLGTVNSPASGTTFALGVTTVTASATDSGGNTATKTFTVTVVDTTPPAITVPAALTVPATGAGGAVVTFATTATDSVSGARATNNSPASGTTFPVGTTTVTTTASDAAGNIASKTFTVTVTPPLAAPGAPTGLGATAGDSQVSLTWNTAPQASGYRVKRATTSGGSYTTVASNLTATSYTDTGLSNGSTYYYVVTATNAGGESGNSAEASVTLPGGGTGTTSYVTGTVLGSVRNNYTGWIGIQIVVGANPLTVSQLGRAMAPGNTGTHAVKLVKASDGQDVAGSVVNIATSGGTVGQFQYAALNSPVTLAANTTYLLVTQETAGGDVWYDYYATVTTTGVATDTAVVWGTGPGDWSALGVSNQAFGPLDFKYGNAVTAGPPTVTVPSNMVAEATGASGAVVTFTTSAVSSTGAVLGTVNSPASGTTFALGVTTVTASATDSGGNTATKTFTVTVVDTTPPAITVPAALTVPATGAGGAVVTFATTATDSVSGARATNNSPASGTTFPVGTTTVTTTASDAAGNIASKTFTVTVTPPLAAPGAPTGLGATAGDSQVSLTWNTAPQASGYRVKRATTSGGSYTTVASNLTATSYTDTGLSNGSTYYYVVTATNAGGESGNSAEASVTLPGGGTGTTSYVTGTVLGSVRNNYTGWIGIQIVVGANPLTVSQLGRAMAPGNTGTHAVKLVKASDGQDVAGSVVNIATSGGTVGQFQYATLISPVTLAANTTYLLVTQETAGGDVWYDYYATLTTTGVATDTAVVWGTGPGDWSALGVSNQAFGPIDFKYY